TPACPISSMYFPIASRRVLLGSVPPSVFLSALRRIMNRIACISFFLREWSLVSRQSAHDSACGCIVPGANQPVLNDLAVAFWVCSKAPRDHSDDSAAPHVV